LEIVACQIDQICAHRLTNAEAAPAAPIRRLGARSP
jgi:hypothetical protein